MKIEELLYKVNKTKEEVMFLKGQINMIVSFLNSHSLLDVDNMIDDEQLDIILGEE